MPQADIDHEASISGDSEAESGSEKGPDDYWNVEEILQERNGWFKVRWEGVDKQGKPYPLDWVPKRDCNPQLIEEWNAKKAEKKRRRTTGKGRKAKASRQSAASTSKKRSESTSTTTTTRQTRRNTNASLPSTTARSPSHAQSNRASSSRKPQDEGKGSKRRKAGSDVFDEDVGDTPGDLSRPRKKRKVEVEVVKAGTPEHTPELESSYAVVPQKRFGKTAAIGLEADDEEAAIQPSIPHDPAPNGKASKGRRRAADDIEEEAEEEAPTVPLTKIGPPRPSKRSRKSKSDEPLPPNTRKGAPTSPSPVSGPSRQSPGRAKGPHAPSRSNAPPSLQLSAVARRLLAQEEEENTQEAAGYVSSPVSRRSGSTKVTEKRASALGDSSPEAGPSRPNRAAALQGRPSANDTFSRDGIVPETQPQVVPNSPNPPSPQTASPDGLASNHDLPSTPARAHSGRQPSASRSASSVKAKMKRKRASTKELRPVPSLSPSVFRPHLPSADFDDIEDFSSPEKDTRKKGVTLNVSTQESIEVADFTQELENELVDWNGGMQPEEDPFTADGDDGPEFSTGPELLAPDKQARSREAMVTVFTERPAPRKERAAEVAASPEVPLQELPPTSTTQRAEVDSQSQNTLNSQIVELNALLDDKEEQLTQLEHQLEELQAQISHLEAEKGEEATTFQAELRALQEVSDDKSEQISQLESQLVELQLQLTQLTSESDNQRVQYESQIQELKAALEEREEQVSQLEAGLAELQTEIAEVAAENERLAAAAEQQAATDAKYADQLAAAQQRTTILEEELADVRVRLGRAEAESADLAARIEALKQDSERRLKYTEDDRDLFKTLYSEASTHAARLAKENEQLEERATLAEGQARDGLAMVRGTFEEQVRQLRSEVEKWQARYLVVATRDARTDDEVRRRASLEPGLREENERLRREAEVVRADMEKMAGIIAQMTAERAREDADADFEAQRAPWRKVSVSNVEDSSSSESSNASSSSEELEGSLDPDDEMVYVCQYVDGSVMCNNTYATPRDVIEHAQKTHYGGIQLTET
ncbi:hypothetical protein OH77DRAFT_1417658 [Trametes cingulata]|nr:hypothetical protein OH77DRAFT_1417658 [Trametes cingulata]